MVWHLRVLAVLVAFALLGVNLAENVTDDNTNITWSGEQTVEVEDPTPAQPDNFARSVLKAQDDFLYAVSSFFTGFFAQFGRDPGLAGNATKDPRLLKII